MLQIVSLDVYSLIVIDDERCDKNSWARIGHRFAHV